MTLGDDIPISLCIETAWMFFYHNDALSSMIDTTGISDDILIDSTFEDKLLDLLDEYRQLSSDTTYTGMIDEIKDEISNNTGKTIAEIYHDLE